jgi:hypothetical protein
MAVFGVPVAQEGDAAGDAAGHSRPLFRPLAVLG